MVEFDEQIPDSILPLLVFTFFRLGDAAKRPFFQGANLLLGELDQFGAEMFLIARFHDVASERSSTVSDDPACSEVGRWMLRHFLFAG